MTRQPAGVAIARTMPTASLPPLPAALLRPQAYPHAVDDVVLRETHISWVFLTGRFAYKVKKPVQTPFLDFSTLELRRTYCEEEVRLNQRMAPDLYLDVAPITGTVEAPHVGGDGKPMEFAVRMRQFAEEGLLARMLSAGVLTAAHVDELACVLTQFHQQAECVDPASGLGGVKQAVGAAVDNFPLLAPDLPTAASEIASELREWTDVAARDLAATFDARRRDGFVRECHGDLHLGNIVLLPGENAAAAPRVTMFDCIEFNPALRWIDVVSDAAFVVMDLAARGRPDYARRLQNACLEQTGDYAGLAVWPWYLVYRALVRAKVASIRAGQSPSSESEHEASLHEAADYLRLARTYIQPQQPRLVITHGVSGSGKTFGSQRLVDELGAIRLRSDVERKRLAGLPPLAESGSTLDAGLYSAEQTHRTYVALEALAEQVLRSGRTVVVDATFLRRADRERFRQLARRLAVPFAILRFDAPAEVLAERITRRRGDASEASLEVLQRQLATREPLLPDEQSDCLSVEQLAALPAGA